MLGWVSDRLSTKGKGDTMEAMIKVAMQLTAAQIKDAVIKIGGGIVATDIRMVRAALIEAYLRKTSEEQADQLMDEIGM